MTWVRVPLAFFFQAEDGIRDRTVTGVQTCALPICPIDRPRSIGRVQSYYGNFGILVRALCYLKSLGASGLAEVSREAILNANYLKARLRDAFAPSHQGYCLHEFVLSASRQKARGVRALDLAKRLLDFGVH